MKAIRMHAYGGPDVLRFEDIPASDAGPNEVRVNVHAAGVNSIAAKIRVPEVSSCVPLPTSGPAFMTRMRVSRHLVGRASRQATPNSDWHTISPSK
jgi:hypothetical protein